MTPSEFPAVVEAMRSPSFYPHPVATVRFVQTHISWVFLTGDFAYKVKKPVNLGFLDYGTLEKRRALCEKEVRLNSRLAPDVYLGVVEIRRGPQGLRLGGDGVTVETAVKMRELPADRMMDRLLLDGKVTREMVWDVAGMLAKFHASAERTPEITAYGSLANVGQHVMDNFKQTAPHIGLTVTAERHAALKAFTERFLTHEADRFVDRMAKNKICDCHGDLRLASACYTDRPILYDCIEFNDAYRYQDVAAEIAFFSMDLDAHGARNLSNVFVNGYLEWTSDFGLIPMLNFYKTYRACVRAKVASFMLKDPGIGPKEKRSAEIEGKTYFDFAASYIEPPAPAGVLILSGSPGTGKTTVARRVAEAVDGIVIRSDAVRKGLAGLEPTARSRAGFREELYTPAFTEKTYTAILRHAEEVIASGRWVVLDAAYMKENERRKAVELAERRGLPCRILHPVCRPETVRKRLGMRAADTREISDADIDIYDRLSRSGDPFSDDERARVITVDTEGNEAAWLEDIISKIAHNRR